MRKITTIIIMLFVSILNAQINELPLENEFSGTLELVSPDSIATFDATKILKFTSLSDFKTRIGLVKPTGLEGFNISNYAKGFKLINYAGSNSVSHGSVDLTTNVFSTNNSTSYHGTAGIFSFNAGRLNNVTGLKAIGIGDQNIVSGIGGIGIGYANNVINSGIALGSSNTVSGQGSLAVNELNISLGGYSFVAGNGNTSNSLSEFVIGAYSTNYAGSIYGHVLTDRIFNVGNGFYNAGVVTRSDAFTILKNGTITAPSLTNTLINTAGNKALITKEYLSANSTNTNEWSTYSGTRVGTNLDLTLGDYDNSGNGTQIKLFDQVRAVVIGDVTQSNNSTRFNINDNLKSMALLSNSRNDGGYNFSSVVNVNQTGSDGYNIFGINAIENTVGVGKKVLAGFAVNGSNVVEIESNGIITANGFKTQTGLNNEYLKADGTVSKLVSTKDFTGRYYFHPDNRWVGNNSSYGVSTENNSTNHGITNTINTIWYELGIGYLPAGTILHKLEFVGRVNSTQVTDIEIQLSGNGSNADLNGWNNNTTANNVVILPTTAIGMQTPGKMARRTVNLGDYELLEGKILSFVCRPVGTLTATRYWTTNAVLYYTLP